MVEGLLLHACMQCMMIKYLDSALVHAQVIDKVIKRQDKKPKLFILNR